MESIQHPIIQGMSKDSELLLSIPDPVSENFHLYANILSKLPPSFLGGNVKCKDRQHAQKMIRNYIEEEIADIPLFWISRLNNQQTTEDGTMKQTPTVYVEQSHYFSWIVVMIKDIVHVDPHIPTQH
jgi:hypothetical protein